MPFAVKKKPAVITKSSKKPAGRFAVKSIQEPSVANGSPRKPSVSICGYAGIDNKGKKYDVCTLPEGHDGAHSQVEAPLVPATVLRREQTSCPVELEFDNSVDTTLTDILYAWKKIGNSWCTSLEADLEVFSRGLKFENKIDNLDAVRALVFLGYMDRKEPDRSTSLPVTRYRLSKKGVDAVNRIAVLIGDLTTDPMVDDEPAMISCANCGGDGYDEENNEVCTVCQGEGEIIAPKKVAKHKTAKDIAHEKMTKGMVEQLKAKQQSKSTPEKTPVKRVFTGGKYVDGSPIKGEYSLQKDIAKFASSTKPKSTILEAKYMTVGAIKQAKGQKLEHGDAFRLASSVMHDCPDPECDGGVYSNGEVCSVCNGDAEVDYKTLDNFNAHSNGSQAFNTTKTRRARK